MIPQAATANIEIQEDQPGLTFGIDFETGKVVSMIDDKDSISQAVYMILRTDRFKYEALSWDYGAELDELIGQSPDYVYLELERRIKEALLMDDRITGATDFVFSRTKNEITVTFTVKTVLGDIEAERTVTV